MEPSQEQFINIDLFTNGNLSEIKRQINLGIKVPSNAMDQTIINNYLNIVEYLYSFPEFQKKINSDMHTCAMNGSLDILKYFVSRGRFPKKEHFHSAIFWNQCIIIEYLFSIKCEYNPNIINLVMHSCTISVLTLLLEHGTIVSEEAPIRAAKLGRIDIVLLFLERGYTLKEAPGFYLNAENEIKMLQLYHQLELPGKYKNLCKENSCRCCYIHILRKLWELETEIYTNYIQLLPRELVEDLEGLLLNTSWKLEDSDDEFGLFGTDEYW